MKNWKTFPRVLELLLALLLFAALPLSLSGCSGKKTETINSQWTSADGEDAVTYFARIIPQSAEAREKFVAASRGYNMSAEGFDDSNLPAPDPSGVSLDGARAALQLVKPTDDASIQYFNRFSEALTAEQVQAIVSRMGETVDLNAKNGALATVLVWIGKFLQMLTRITGGSYVLGLFIFAIILEILMLPFGIRQQKNSIKQARMRPKEMAIRKKYAGRNDQVTQRKLNEEIQKMYQEEGFNPLGGCLPLLIQMPIILALYQIVIDPLRYVLGKSAALSGALSTYCTTARAAGGLGVELGSGKGTIELLSNLSVEKLEGLRQFAYFSNAGECSDALSGIAIPNFRLFGANMGLIPGFRPPYGLLVIPVLTFLVYFASMKLNRKLTYQPVANNAQTGCSNNLMDITMPLMSVYITFIVPAAVGIYWMFKCVISTFKQFVIQKVMPLPTFTEEDYKEAERVLKGKSKPENSAGAAKHTPSGRPVRSLHHIDDDDEALPPPVAEPEEPTEDKDEQKDMPGMAAPLKEDRKDGNNETKRG